LLDVLGLLFLTLCCLSILNWLIQLFCTLPCGLFSILSWLLLGFFLRLDLLGWSDIIDHHLLPLNGNLWGNLIVLDVFVVFEVSCFSGLLGGLQECCKLVLRIIKANFDLVLVFGDLN